MRFELWQQIFTPRMLVAFSMGFSCGVPLLLTLSLLQAWMKEEGVSLEAIGLLALAGLPYIVKFLWAPIFDRYVPPFLGRRRGWLLLVQLLLMVVIALLGVSNPARSPLATGMAACLVAFFSASQDIIVDAYRREDLSDRELGLGSSMYVNGYRVGMLLAGSGGLILADHFPFATVYLIMATSLLVGLITTLLCKEPPLPPGRPRSLEEAVIQPFVDFFSRHQALLALLFILLYKIGDQMATTMTTPFYLELGFSKTQIGTVAKLFGFWATIGGGVLGGLILLRIGIMRSLMAFGVLQAVSILGFTVLALIGKNLSVLAAVIAFENLSGGMGTAAYVAYMASLTNKRFTATQYALLASMMGIPRVFASAPTGWMVTWLGWPMFFAVCTCIAIPGLLLIPRIAAGFHENSA